MADKNKNTPEKQEKTNGTLEKRFQRGNCVATIFRNKICKDGEEFSVKSIVLQKNYKDAEGKWQSTNSFNINDLPRISLVADKAYD